MQNRINALLAEYESGRMSRRDLLVRMGVLVAAAAGADRAWGADAAAPAQSTFQATELNHIALRVTDVARSREFYTKHLGLRVSRDGGDSAFLNFGNNFLALFRGDEPRMDHYCYSVKDYDVAEAERKLKAAGLQNIRRTGGRIYFSDPDGLTVQLAATEHMP